MKYDFDQVTNRTGTNSVKWEFVDAIFDVFAGEDLLPLWVADMDFECPQPVVDAIKERAGHGIFGYSMPDEGYYAAVIGWMKRRHGWEIEKDWIVLSRGVVPAIGYCVQTFTDPGDKVIIQRPVYYPFTNMIVNNGREVLNNPLIYENNRYTIDFVDLEAKAKDPAARLMIFCSPHNPVGRVWTPEELERVGSICLDNGIILVSDELHGDLVFPGHRHYPLTSISPRFRRNTIICTAPSKTFNLAGLQTSNIIIADADLRRDFVRTAAGRNSSSDVNPFGIVATTAAYDQGEEWLIQVLDYIYHNMEFIDSFCREHLPGVKLVKPEGTYLAWLDFTEVGLEKDQLTEIIIKKAGVALDEGYFFGEEGTGFERVNTACPRVILEECMNRIRRALNG